MEYQGVFDGTEKGELLSVFVDLAIENVAIDLFPVVFDLKVGLGFDIVKSNHNIKCLDLFNFIPNDIRRKYSYCKHINLHLI